jgi:hypothetical protein
MKDRLLPLVYLAATTLLLRVIFPPAPVKKRWKTYYDLLKTGIGPLLITDLALPLGNRKTPVI